jgi:hypothetical protein
VRGVALRLEEGLAHDLRLVLVAGHAVAVRSGDAVVALLDQRTLAVPGVQCYSLENILPIKIEKNWRKILEKKIGDFDSNYGYFYRKK